MTQRSWLGLLPLFLWTSLAQDDENGFDFGSGCVAGTGAFSRTLSTRFGTSVLGIIPADKYGVRVELNAPVDIDIQLLDIFYNDTFDEGQAIIAYCEPIDCNIDLTFGTSPTEVTADYVRPGIELMTITYSGYNGQNGALGDEFIEFTGKTTTDIKMRVYAYKTGTAVVNYKWDRSQSDCCRGIAQCPGAPFNKFIKNKELVTIGEIPVGKVNVRIYLKADLDVDVQIYDQADTVGGKFPEGKAIIGYCEWAECNVGFLAGPSRDSYTHKGLEYVYSGYNGDGDSLGNEYIEILGTTNTPLTMKAFGYTSGTAAVTYSWYELAESDTRAVCYDTVGWLDIDDFSCDRYTSCLNEGWKDQPASYYEQWANSEGVSALDACCECGKVSTCSEPDSCAGMSNQCADATVASECVCTCSDYVDLGQCISTRTIKPQKIVGGEAAEAREFPWLVSLQTGFGDHFCGGTLIGPTWVLTAAHCNVDYLDNVVIGAHKLSESSPVPGGCTERIKVKRKIPHPNYSNSGNSHDIMLLELVRATSYPAAKLAKNLANEVAGTDSLIAGWGTTSSGGQLTDVLLKATIPIADQNLCASNYAPQGITIDQSMICAGFEEGGRDSCQGDSGGPLFNAQNQELVGVVSFGIGCAFEKYYGVYAKVSDHYDWIKSIAVVTAVAPTNAPTHAPTTRQPTKYPTTAVPTRNPTRPLPPTEATGTTTFPTVLCANARASSQTQRTLKQFQAYDYEETKFYGVAEVDSTTGGIVVCGGVMVAANMFLTNTACEDATTVFLSTDQACFSSISVVGRSSDRWGLVLQLESSLPSTFPLANINTLPANQLTAGSQLTALGQVEGEPMVQSIELLDATVCREIFGSVRATQVCAGFAPDSVKLSRQATTECNTVPGTPLLKLVGGEYYVVAMARGKEELPAAGCGEAAGIYERVDALVGLANLLSNECVDLPGWVDFDGDDCSVYTSCENGGWMDEDTGYYETWTNNQGLSALDACCICGYDSNGGTDSSAPSPAPAGGGGSCFTADGEYTGLLSEALSNDCDGYESCNIVTTPCVDWEGIWWDDDFILTNLAGTSNCRNPDADPGGPWCIVANQQWAYCDVGTPDDPNCGSAASPTTQEKTTMPTASPPPTSGVPAGSVDLTGNCYMSDGCFHSPNFPEDYADMTNCVLDGWQGLEVEIHSFFTEAGYDILQNGYYNYSGAVGLDVNPSFVVEDVLTFTSDGSVTNAGFKICPMGTPHQMTVIGDCEFDGGCLKTPNYGQYSYSADMYCFLDGWQGLQVSGLFSTEAGYDFLLVGEEVFDGDGSLQNQKVIGPIVFMSDGSVEADGFEICTGASPTMPTLPPSSPPSAPPGGPPAPPTNPPTFDPATCDETLSGPNDNGYRGCQSRTQSGKECQSWTSQTPHEHGMDLINYPGSGVGNHNYCRNPDNDETIWCYTTDASVRWEFCDPLPAAGTPTTAPPTVPPPTAECQGHNDCSAGEYCRSTLECVPCGFLTAGCDTFDQQCCSSSAFTNACPNHDICSGGGGGGSSVVPDSCKPAGTFSQRIVGGVNAIKGEFPWIVSVQTSGGFHYCGGSLISPTKVLTAAHCEVGPGDRVVIGAHKLSQVGSNNECTDIIDVESSVAHEGYSRSTLDNDIMIVTLSKATWWPHFIDIVTGAEIADNSPISVSGWGTLSEGGNTPDTLQKVTTLMQSRAKCREQYGQNDITDNMMCAGESQGGKDSCQGDSGGPLFSGTGIDAVQHGVVSWGISCADRNFFGVYTNLVKYSGPGEWICQKINNQHKSC